MPDKREEILFSEFGKTHPLFDSDNESEKERVVNAMDENGKQMCLDLLEFLSSNNVKCGKFGVDGGNDYFYKGAWITKEQLFENFL